MFINKLLRLSGALGLFACAAASQAFSFSETGSGTVYVTMVGVPFQFFNVYTSTNISTDIPNFTPDPASVFHTNEVGSTSFFSDYFVNDPSGNDLLDYRITGTATYTDGGNTVTFVGTGSVLYGTGIFLNATGSGNFTEVQSVASSTVYPGTGTFTAAFNGTVVPAPEPAAMPLLLVGSIAAFVLKRKLS